MGLEGQVDWLGTRLGHSFDLQLTAAVFGWNDPAGTHARGARLRAARPPDHVVRPRRRAAARSRAREERIVPRDRRPARATTSARRRATSIAPCSTSCTTTIAPTPRCTNAVDPRLRVADEIRCRRAARRNRQWLDGDPAGARWRYVHRAGRILARLGVRFAVRAAREALRARTWSPCATTQFDVAFTRRPARSRQRRRPRLDARVFVRSRRPLALRARMAARESDVPARVDCSASPRSPRESKLEFSARYLLSGSF